MLFKKLAAAASLALFAAGSSVAAPVVYNLALPNISTFDNVITSTGAAVTTAKVAYGVSSYSYVDLNGHAATVTVTRTSTGAAAGADETGYTSRGTSLSGAAWNIDPQQGAGGGVGGKPDIEGFNSGLTFTFSSPVNAFGFEIGDWSTCCHTDNTRSAAVQSAYNVAAQGSGLWIAFDGGAATLPANALKAEDNPGFAQFGSYTNFIGAIDSSGTFTKITFFGDGFGEFLVAGGTLRFASVAIGSVGGELPEPGSIALVGLALAGGAFARRRKNA